MLVRFCGVSAGENILAEPLLSVSWQVQSASLQGEKKKHDAARVCPAETACGRKAVFHERTGGL